MIKIKVLNKKGLAACVAASSKDETRRHLCCILIEPSGVCVGLDGWRMAVSENCVEAFEGDSIMLSIGKLTASQINSDSECTIFIDGEESRLSFAGSKRSMLPVSIYSGEKNNFPDYSDVIAKACDKMNAFKFQADLLYDIDKILNHGAKVSGVRLSQSGESKDPICVQFDGDKKTTLTLMPMRDE